MRDYEVELRNHVLAQLPAPAGVAQRVYAGLTLPTGYKPADGRAILMRMAGGDTDYSGHMLRPVMQIECYGPTEADAVAVDLALLDILNNKRVCGGYCRVQTLGTLLADPETEWRFVLSYYQLFVLAK